MLTRPSADNLLSPPKLFTAATAIPPITSYMEYIKDEEWCTEAQ